MGVGIFRRCCTIRRFKPQEDVPGGYVTSQYEDVVTSLNVQPLSTKELMTLPEGDRRIKRLKTFGDLQLTASDQDQGILGDWLFYHGAWYKCVSAIHWEHTMLAHCRSEFVMIPESDLPFCMEPPGMELPETAPEETVPEEEG